MRRKFGFMIVFVALLLFASWGASAQMTPYLPPGASLPRVELPAGVDPNPNLLPKEAGKVTLNFLFRAEEGLRLNLKVFMTDPQDRRFHWQERSIPPMELATAPIPIKGSLDTGEGLIKGPMVVKPGVFPLMTLVVDNRKGTDEARFYIPSPNPKVDFLLSSDTDPDVLFKIVPKCLCASTVYTAPKGGIWYRVIGMYIADDAPTPSRATVIMDLMKAPRAAGH